MWLIDSLKKAIITSDRDLEANHSVVFDENYILQSLKSIENERNTFYKNGNQKGVSDFMINLMDSAFKIAEKYLNLFSNEDLKKNNNEEKIKKLLTSLKNNYKIFNSEDSLNQINLGELNSSITGLKEIIENPLRNYAMSSYYSKTLLVMGCWSAAILTEGLVLLSTKDNALSEDLGIPLFGLTTMSFFATGRCVKRPVAEEFKAQTHSAYGLFKNWENEYSKCSSAPEAGAGPNATAGNSSEEIKLITLQN